MPLVPGSTTSSRDGIASFLAQMAGSLGAAPTSIRFLAGGTSLPPQTSRPLIVPKLPCACASTAPQTIRATVSQAVGKRAGTRLRLRTAVTNVFTDGPLCLLEPTLQKSLGKQIARVDAEVLGGGVGRLDVDGIA